MLYFGKKRLNEGTISSDSSTFVITSVVYPKKDSNSLNICNERDNRRMQTIKTIDSIKMYCPGANIVLLDGGVVDPRLRSLVDYYHYYGDDQRIRIACDSNNKGLGEVQLLHKWIKEDYTNQFNRYYIKISGRYELTKDFNLNRFSDEFISMKVYERYKFFQRLGLHSWSEILKGSYSTRLYCVPGQIIFNWDQWLQNALVDLNNGISLEQALPRAIGKRKINFVDMLGIEGYVAGKEYICE